MAAVPSVRATGARPWIRGTGLALTALLAAAAAACGGGEGASRDTTTTSTAPATTTTTAGADGGAACGIAGGRDITFPAGRKNATLHAVTTGSGSTAVVLAHESDDNACAWAFFVPQLAAKGRQVLAFDFSGKGQSDYVGDGRLDLDVLAAVGQARKQGATKVVVMGASMGGTAVVTAAGSPTSGIAGVVSISAPASYLSADAEAAAAHLEVPVLFAASRNDRSYAQVAQAMSRSCGCAYPKVFLFDGSLHGLELLKDGSAGPPLRAGIDQLLARALR